MRWVHSDGSNDIDRMKQHVRQQETATAEQNWRRKEPTPRRKQPTNVKINGSQEIRTRVRYNERKSNNAK